MDGPPDFYPWQREGGTGSGYTPAKTTQKTEAETKLSKAFQDVATLVDLLTNAAKPVTNAEIATLLRKIAKSGEEGLTALKG